MVVDIALDDLAERRAAYGLILCQDLAETTPEDDLPDLLIGLLHAMRPDGLIIWCGCNREIVEALGWLDIHQQYGEWQSDEACALLSQAGFDILSVSGTWLCRDQERMLPFAADDAQIASRVMLGVDRPRDSLGWCVIARRRGVGDAGLLREAIRNTADAARRSRLRRFRTDCGQSVWDGSRHWFEAGADRHGALLFGPYSGLPARAHGTALELQVIAADKLDGVVATIDAVADGDHVLFRCDIESIAFDQDSVFRLAIDLPNTTILRNFQLRVFKHRGFALSVCRDIEIAAR